MGHTGRGRRVRRVLSETGFYHDEKPKQILSESIFKDAILDGDQLIGEFQGNSNVVLIGLNSSSVLDPVNILNNNEKGVIIGFTESTTHFSIYHNDGLGTKIILQIPDKLKDYELHTFEINIKSNNTVKVRFDGYENTLTTKIPSINDTLKLVNYGIY